MLLLPVLMTQIQQWNGQNLITVGGINIENVNLKGNYNSYYEGCNKVLELIGNGKNLTSAM